MAPSATLPAARLSAARWLAVTLAGGTLAAQSAEVLGLVHSDSGRPVAGATVRFVADPGHGLAWLAPLAPPPAVDEGHTDDDGRFRFAVSADHGCLFVDEGAGLGAVVPAVAVGTPVRVPLAALGAVQLDDAGPFRAHVHVLRPGREPAPLGLLAGVELRLPPATYLLLVVREDRAAEHRVTVRSGRRTTLRAPRGTGAPLELPAGVTARLGRWPEVELGRSLPELAGPDALRLAVRESGGRARFTSAWLDGEASVVEATAPASGTWRPVLVVDEGDVALDGATVWTVADAEGGPLVVARAPDAWLDAELRSPVRVVASAPGRRPRTFGPDEVPDRITLEPARPAAFRLVGPDGDPAADARVTVRSPDSRLLDRVLISDPRGRVALPDGAGTDVEVHVGSDRFLPLDVTLRPNAERSPPIVVLARGLTIHGVAWLGAGSPAADVEVELRDPTGTLGLEPRRVVTAEDGGFRVEGLPDGLFTLFAQTRVDGVTWSGRLRGVQPGPDEWRLELRSEDPPLPGTGRD